MSTSSDRGGRPRDPHVDRRIEEAAVDVFGSVGLAGFTMDAVAKAAGVGKASIYLRWSSREALLAESVSAAFRPLAAIDTGDLRDDLLALTHALLDLYAGPHGRAARRMVVEAESSPVVAEQWVPVRAAQVRTTRAIVRRAIARGEVGTGIPVDLVLETLCGAVMIRAVAAPGKRPARERYAAQLVDFVLSALTT